MPMRELIVGAVIAQSTNVELTTVAHVGSDMSGSREGE